SIRLDCQSIRLIAAARDICRDFAADAENRVEITDVCSCRIRQNHQTGESQRENFAPILNRRHVAGQEMNYWTQGGEREIFGRGRVKLLRCNVVSVGVKSVSRTSGTKTLPLISEIQFEKSTASRAVANGF